MSHGAYEFSKIISDVGFVDNIEVFLIQSEFQREIQPTGKHRIWVKNEGIIRWRRSTGGWEYRPNFNMIEVFYCVKGYSNGKRA